MLQKQTLPHIQALRGIAIFLILLFHLNPHWCPNGFFGVDVFLVISGYFLIGKQLTAETNFRWGEFISKKLCRILPPMLAVCLGCTLLATLLPTSDMSAILRQILWSLAGAANINLSFAVNDYFAADTRSMPMMHLWYMGLIIQSYLFYAVLFFLWQILRLKRRSKKLSLVLIIIVSISFHFQWVLHTIGWAGTEVTASTYYLTSARLWELGFGGLLFGVSSPVKGHSRLSGIFGCMAISLIILLSFLDFENSPRYALLVVCCTCLYIRWGANNAISNIFNNVFFTSLGNISFSVYLLHWPIICLVEQFFGIRITAVSASFILPGILLLSYALYYFAERPRLKVSVTILLHICCSSICVILLHTGSLRLFLVNQALNIETLPYSPHTANIDDSLRMGLESFPVQWEKQDGTAPDILYHLGDDTKPASFALLGDSHAERLMAGFDIAGKEKGWSGVYLNTYIVPFWDAYYENVTQPKHTFTKEKGENLLRWLQQHPSITHVIIVQYWSDRFISHHSWDGLRHTGKDINIIREARCNELRELCVRLKRIGKSVIVFTDNPTIDCANPRQQFLQDHFRGVSVQHPNTSCTRQQYEEKNHDFFLIANQLASEGVFSLIHIEDSLFEDGVFSYKRGNKLLIRDKHHLSYFGGYEALHEIADVIQEALRSSGKSSSEER